MNPMTQQCTAQSKQARRRCKRLVIGGGPCYIHGGAAPQVAARRAARVIEAESLAESLLAGVPWIERDPGEALLAATSDADALVQRIKSQLVRLDQVDPAAMTALGDWIDRVGRLSKLVLDARIDERRTRVTEQQGELLIATIRGILDDLNLTSEQRALVSVVVPKWLRKASGQAPLRAVESGGRS